MIKKLDPIAVVHSPFKEKFGIPRQPSIIKDVKGELVFSPEYSHPEFFKELEGFSHLWLIFDFHLCEPTKNTSVRPPRLGGNKKVGVFATRSPFRPNPLGLSVVKLEKIYKRNKNIVVEISGHDLVHGTPVIDVKPYIAEYDSIPEATSGWLEKQKDWQKTEVDFSQQALQKIQEIEPDEHIYLTELITRILREDPRPSHRRMTEEDDQVYAMKISKMDVQWTIQNNSIYVGDITPLC